MKSNLLKTLIIFLLSVNTSLSQSSLNMSLLGSLNYNNTQCNDIWGWVDSTGNEYALVGLRNGFSCVNVTNPSNPVEEFYIPDMYSTWRDIKTYEHYAYITTEADAGLLIVDLNDMSGSTYWHVKDFTNPSNGITLHWEAAHDIYIDENGIAYIFGASNPFGLASPPNGAIFLDLTIDPVNPSYIGNWNDEYIHDGMVRGDTMWAGCVYAGKMYAVDVSNKSNPVSLGSVTTPNAFTHNVWVSDNGNFVFTTDEQSDAYLTAYDVSDLSNIIEVDRIQSNPGSNSIPHNTFVDGNFLITSYYRDGTTVHDITFPDNMIQVAYYDSYSGSGNGFDGCWGTYPYLPSGNIISSDINSNNGNGQLLIYQRNFQQACHLEGYVYDATTNLPIYQASINILNNLNNTSTNLNGYYQSSQLDSGVFQIVYSANGYISDTININFINGIMLSQDVYLNPPCNNSSNTSVNSIEICENQSYSIGNSTYFLSGSYFDTIQSVLGCDSIINTLLNVIPSNIDTLQYTLCFGDNISLNNNTYDQSGVYYDSLQTINGCDSVILIDLIVQPELITNQTFTLCDGESISVGQSIYSNPGFYSNLLISSNGCDSAVNTTLIILPEYNNINSINLCSGDSVIVGPNIYTISGTYIDSFLTINQCDSIVTTTVSVSDMSALINFNNINNSLDLDIFGGIPPYNYLLFNQNTNILDTIYIGSSLNYSPLTGGMYNLIGIDQYGCITDTASYFLDVSTNLFNVEKYNNYKQFKFDLLGRNSTISEMFNLHYNSKKGRTEKLIIIK